MRSAYGSIQEIIKGQLYRIYVEGGRDPDTGKRIRLTKVKRGSRRDAEIEKMALQAKVGKPEETNSLTLDEFWNSRYLPYCVETLRPDTVVNYVNKYRKYIRGPLGNKQLSAISPYMVDEMLAKIDGDNKKFEAYKTLRQILRKAGKWRLLSTNVCEQVDITKKSKYTFDRLTSEEAAEYIAHAKGTDIEPAILLAIGGGFRRSEIAGLDWCDISKDGAVTIDNAITMVQGKPHNDDAKTASSVRVVNMPPSITKRLNEIRGKGRDPILISKRTGERMTPDGLYRRYKRWQEKLPDGLPRITMKNLRHTSLSLAHEAGADLEDLRNRAGHASIAVTSKYYLKASPEQDRKVAGKLDDILGGKM